MKKYTQADFDAFEVIDGIKQCPSGDYSDIQVFSDRCSFGEDCSFGEECSFEGKGEYIGDYPSWLLSDSALGLAARFTFSTCKTAFMSVAAAGCRI